MLSPYSAQSQACFVDDVRYGVVKRQRNAPLACGAAANRRLLPFFGIEVRDIAGTAWNVEKPTSAALRVLAGSKTASCRHRSCVNDKCKIVIESSFDDDWAAAHAKVLCGCAPRRQFVPTIRSEES